MLMVTAQSITVAFSRYVTATFFTAFSPKVVIVKNAIIKHGQTWELSRCMRQNVVMGDAVKYLITSDSLELRAFGTKVTTIRTALFWGSGSR